MLGAQTHMAHHLLLESHPVEWYGAQAAGSAAPPLEGSGHRSHTTRRVGSGADGTHVTSVVSATTVGARHGPRSRNVAAR